LESAEGLKTELGNDLDKVQHVVDNNKGLFAGVAGVLVVVVLGYFGYKYYATIQDEEGQAKLFNAVYQFEADSNKVAAKELTKVADDFGGNAGNLANFYAGVANLKEGKYDAAIDQLNHSVVQIYWRKLVLIL